MFRDFTVGSLWVHRASGERAEMLVVFCREHKNSVNAYTNFGRMNFHAQGEYAKRCESVSKEDLTNYLLQLKYINPMFAQYLKEFGYVE